MTRFNVVMAACATTLGMATKVGAMEAVLRVVEPASGETVIAERHFPVVWTGGSKDAGFEVDLHYMGSYSYDFEDDCGTFYQHLCSDSEIGCSPDSSGSFEALMPKPVGGSSGHGYKVKVTEVGAALQNSACSAEFYLSVADATMMEGWGLGMPSIAVVTPGEHSVAYAGEEYAVEFDFDNTWEFTTELFKIDLYEAQGSSDCGTWVTSVCDKPDTGCEESLGDYDVLIPQRTPGGMYRIRVGVFADDTVFGCSVPFEVIPLPADKWSEDLWV